MRTAVLCCLASSLLTAALVLLLCPSPVGVRAQVHQAGKGWEYKVTGKDEDFSEPAFNKVGADGWEYVGYTPNPYQLVFKRPKR